MKLNRQRTFNRPSTVKPAVDYGWFYSENDRPILRAKRGSVFSQHAVPSRVPHLLRLHDPSAISRLVISIVVNAINGVFWAWSLSHIGEKVSERQPAVANGYSTTTVSCKLWPSLSCASSHDPFPNAILAGLIHAVLCMLLTTSFAIEASAASRPFRKKAGLENEARGAAFAKTMPFRRHTRLVSRYDGESSEYASYEVPGFRSPSSAARIGVSHEKALSQEGHLWLEPHGVSRTAAVRLLYLIQSERI